MTDAAAAVWQLPYRPTTPGKVNPTRREALAMIAVQVMANGVAEIWAVRGQSRNECLNKPLMISTLIHPLPS